MRNSNIRILPSSGFSVLFLGLSLGLYAGALASCSLANNDVTHCKETSECREAFGIGSVCMDNGYCGPVSEPRCEKTFPANLLRDPTNPNDTIIIGNIMNRANETHRARENSAQLAFDSINSSGQGIDGRTFGVVFCTIEEDTKFDDLTANEAAVASARYLADVVGVPAIIGPSASSDTQAVFSSLKSSGSDILVISPSATSTVLSDLDPQTVSDESPGLLWRTAPPDDLQSAAIVHDMTADPNLSRLSKKPTNVAIIFQEGAYGDALAASFVTAFQTESRTARPFQFSDPNEQNELVGNVGLNGAVDEVLFISSKSDDIVAFLNAAAASDNYTAKQIFLTDSAANTDVLTRANGARFNNVRGSRPAPLDQSTSTPYTTFVSAYAGTFSADSTQFSFVAHSYDAAWLVGYGVAWAILQENGQITGTNIARGLRKISDTSVAEIEIAPSTWIRVLNEFEAGKSVNISGASGDLDYDPLTEETSAPFEIWKIDDNNEVESLYTFEPEG